MLWSVRHYDRCLNCLTVAYKNLKSTECLEPRTYTRWLGPTPGSIILTVPSCGTNQYQWWKAGEEHRGKVSESSVLTPALSWDPWIPTEHSCKAHKAV